MDRRDMGCSDLGDSSAVTENTRTQAALCVSPEQKEMPGLYTSALSSYGKQTRVGRLFMGEAFSEKTND